MAMRRFEAIYGNVGSRKQPEGNRIFFGAGNGCRTKFTARTAGPLRSPLASEEGTKEEAGQEILTRSGLLFSSAAPISLGCCVMVLVYFTGTVRGIPFGMTKNARTFPPEGPPTSSCTSFGGTWSTVPGSKTFGAIPSASHDPPPDSV